VVCVVDEYGLVGACGPGCRRVDVGACVCVCVCMCGCMWCVRLLLNRCWCARGRVYVCVCAWVCVCASGFMCFKQLPTHT